MKPERWAPVRGIDGYMVSDSGMIRSFRRGSNGKVLNPGMTRDGYYRANLGGKCIYVHHVVWISFVGAVRRELQINHMNGVRTDNSLGNLEICTRQENQRHGCAMRQESFLLNDDAVRLVRFWGGGREPNSILAKLFSCAPSYICNVVNYKKRANVPEFKWQTYR